MEVRGGSGGELPFHHRALLKTCKSKKACRTGHIHFRSLGRVFAAVADRLLHRAGHFRFWLSLFRCFALLERADSQINVETIGLFVGPAPSVGLAIRRRTVVAEGSAQQEKQQETEARQKQLDLALEEI